jgi:hypothetical protein
VIGGRLSGRPEAGIESRHLLSGFVICGVCGGSMHAITRTSGGRRTPRWTRTYYEALREEVLTPDLVEDVVARAIALWGERHAGLDTERRRLEAERRRVEQELGRFAEAIAAGARLPTLLDAMQDRERRRAELLAQLEHVDGLGRTLRPALTPELRASLRERLTAWSALLGSDPSEARPILRQLLVGRLTCQPRRRPEGRCYQFSATATFGGLLQGAVAGLVPPG